MQSPSVPARVRTDGVFNPAVWKLKGESADGHVDPSTTLGHGQARATHPDNLMAKLFDFDYYMTLPADMQTRLLYICKSGAENADSG